jgi:GxxExxY protein
MSELLYRGETYKIIGICMQVHKELSMGLKELNYKDAMESEFCENGIPYQRENRFVVMYKSVPLSSP